MPDSVAAADPGLSATWRPQGFGEQRARQIEDPLIEPLWSGVRVLVHLDGGAAEIVDVDGETVIETTIATAVAEALQADSAVIDGYLTSDPTRTGEGVIVGSGVRTPSAGQMTRRLLIGGSPEREARVEALRRTSEALAAAEAGRPGLGERVVLVAVDLLALDGDSLLDVPLLERKRLLDAVVDEADLVRRGIHVRPPADRWLATWRSLGFSAVAYKAANSRYRPGEPNDGWAVAALPTR